MKARIATALALAMAASLSSPLSRAQQRNAKPSTTPFTHKVFYYHPRKEPMTPEAMDLVRSQAAASQTIQLWTYSTVAQDGKTYTGRWLAVNVGVGQYLDEFQRANFWAKVAGTPYHTTFNTTPTVLAPVHVTVPTSDGVTVSALSFGGCMDTGTMDINWWDNEVQTVALAGTGN